MTEGHHCAGGAPQPCRRSGRRLAGSVVVLPAGVVVPGLVALLGLLQRTGRLLRRTVRTEPVDCRAALVPLDRLVLDAVVPLVAVILSHACWPPFVLSSAASSYGSNLPPLPQRCRSARVRRHPVRVLTRLDAPCHFSLPAPSHPVARSPRPSRDRSTSTSPRRRRSRAPTSQIPTRSSGCGSPASWPRRPLPPSVKRSRPASPPTSSTPSATTSSSSGAHTRPPSATATTPSRCAPR